MGEKILVVDDEEAIRQFLNVSLTSQGYVVVEAASGREALSLVNHEHPDLIILDLVLPDINGVEITRQLRQWTQIPIIIQSVRGSEVDKIAALDAGADDYLTKPFGAGELLARIRVAWRHKSHPFEESVFVNGALTVRSCRKEDNGLSAGSPTHSYRVRYFESPGKSCREGNHAPPNASRSLGRTIWKRVAHAPR